MSDQAIVPVDKCVRWHCDSQPLLQDSSGFWICPKCMTNYGRDAIVVVVNRGLTKEVRRIAQIIYQELEGPISAPSHSQRQMRQWTLCVKIAQAIANEFLTEV